MMNQKGNNDPQLKREGGIVTKGNMSIFLIRNKKIAPRSLVLVLISKIYVLHYHSLYSTITIYTSQQRCLIYSKKCSVGGRVGIVCNRYLPLCVKLKSGVDMWQSYTSDTVTAVHLVLVKCVSDNTILVWHNRK